MSGAGDPKDSTGTSPLVQELLARIAERVPAARLPAVREFARAYVRRISPELVPDLVAEELFGQIMGLFELADRRGTEPFTVRAFNPTLASDGYATVGSVVETNCEDSPFLVDSVAEELAAQGLEIRLVIHPVIGTERDAEGRIRRVLHAREAPTRESVMHFEVGRHLAPEQLKELEGRIRLVLGDVQAAVRDFDALQARVPTMIEAARTGTARYAVDEIEEARAFLEWLLDGNFVFLGYREYAFVDEKLSLVPGVALGILRDDTRSRYSTPVPVDAIEPSLRERLQGGNLLVVSKTNRFATVHRRAKMDDITVKRVDAQGNTVALHRLLGLFTRKAYVEPASKTPILARKLRQIAVAEDFLEGSHDYKTLVELYESFPKDELFSASPEELRQTLVRLIDLQERRGIQLFIRRDLDEERVSVLVALPRDRFNAELRQRLQKLFLERFNGSSVDYHLSLGDEQQARIHFTVHVDGPIPEVSFAELEQEVVSLTRTWDDRLRERLVALHGEERGNALADKYERDFPDYYKASTDVYLALLDIEQFERLDAGEPFAVGLQNERGQEQNLTRIGLYKTAGKVRLSDFLPILEHLGLAVVEEVPTRLNRDGDVYLHDFGVLDEHGRTLDLAGLRRARGGGDLGRVARRGRVGLAQPARHQRRADLAPGRRPACVPEVPAARDLGLHRGVPERRVRAQPAHRPRARRAFRGAFRPIRRAQSRRPSRPCALRILADLDAGQVARRGSHPPRPARPRRTPPCARTRSARCSGTSRSSSARPTSRTCRSRFRSTRSSCTRRRWKAFTCAAARWRAAGFAGRTGGRTTAPRSSA